MINSLGTRTETLLCTNLSDRAKLKTNYRKLSFASDITSQQPSNSKCEKICDTDARSRRRKPLILKEKALSFYTIDITYITIRP